MPAAASFTRNAIAQTLGPWTKGEVLRERARLGVDDEVDVALLVEQHVLVANGGRPPGSPCARTARERLGIGHRVLDELETSVWIGCGQLGPWPNFRPRG